MRPALLASLLAFLACSGGRPALVDGVLLITLDTTRADRLGCYGNASAVTPTLDRLASEGVLFAHCETQIPTTLSSHTTILTSLYPRSHLVPRNGFSVPPEVRTIAQILAENGFRTGAFVAAFPLDHAFGLDRGFATYDDRTEETPEGGELERRASSVTDQAIGWLAGVGEKPFFLWVHYFDPHWPYDPLPPYADLRRVPRSSYSTRSLEDLRAIRSGLSPFTAGDRAAFLAAYDGEIAFVDRGIGRLLDAVPEERRSRLLLVVAGDHGEAFGEHLYFFDHGEFLWSSAVDVPLLLHGPSVVAKGRVEESPVRLLDIAPTILDAAGLHVPPEFEGGSLLSAARRPIAPRLSFSEASKPWNIEPESGYKNQFKAKSIREERWKLIVTPFRDRTELYDLWEDPGEMRNLAASETAVASRLEKELLGWIREKNPGFRSEDLTVEDEIREKLKSLGYY